MTIIYLARHGETEWNRQNRWQGQTDIPLNEAGRAQAEALAERLRDAGLARVHASDLRRARETGEIVAARLGVPFIGADARLRERCFGLFEGLTAEECHAHQPEHWRRYLANRAHLPPGAETVEAVIARMLEVVHELARVDGAGLVVSHGAAIRVLVSGVLGAPVPIIGNGAVFKVVVDDGCFVSAELLRGS